MAHLGPMQTCSFCPRERRITLVFYLQDKVSLQTSDLPALQAFPFQPNEISGRGKEFSHSGRAENGARTKNVEGGGGGGGGERRERIPFFLLPHPPSFHFCFRPIFRAFCCRPISRASFSRPYLSFGSYGKRNACYAGKPKTRTNNSPMKIRVIPLNH